MLYKYISTKCFVKPTLDVIIYVDSRLVYAQGIRAGNQDLAFNIKNRDKTNKLIYVSKGYKI